MNKFYSCLVLASIAIGLYSCVPARKLEETEAKLKQCENDMSAAKTRADELEKASKDMEKELRTLKEANNALKNDTLIMGTS
ncbi:MAG TPA: hypothetical protein VK177_01160, partial [Flavobacteriales bacterium]|nr:hypothetical protein [Flavobacteriales bacterium]